MKKKKKDKRKKKHQSLKHINLNFKIIVWIVKLKNNKYNYNLFELYMK